MRRTVLQALAALALMLSTPAFAQDAPAQDPARLAAARDLLEVTGVTKQLDGMMDAMKKGFASGAKADSTDTGKKLSAEFDDTMKRFMAYREDMMNDFAALYAETFTAEEMKTVADFYRSGTGAKFITLTPTLMQKGAVIGMKYSQKVIDGMKANPVAPAAPKP